MTGVLSFRRRRRIRHFSQGVALGHRSFCEEQFHVFRDYIAPERKCLFSLFANELLHPPREVAGVENR